MCNFLFLLFYEFIEIVEGMTKGGKVEKVRDELVASSKKFKNLIAIGIVFDVSPKLVGSKSYWSLGHCQSV
jgi:hypothetical protein